MAKEKKVDLKQEAMEKMESMVEQHNELVKELESANGRLAEIKQMIIAKPPRGPPTLIIP